MNWDQNCNNCENRETKKFDAKVWGLPFLLKKYGDYFCEFDKGLC